MGLLIRLVFVVIGLSWTGILMASDDVKEALAMEQTDDALQGLRAKTYATEKEKSNRFRDYENAPQHVKVFYKEHHKSQTLKFAQEKKAQYAKLEKGEYSILEALEMLTKLVDESDPDLDLPQIQHALQTAEAIRQAGHPDWLILAGLLHDLGKMLAFWGEPQWAVVGDTYPVGCRFSDKIIFANYLDENPDKMNPLYQTELGIYGNADKKVGLENVVMSWGHDEYLYQVIKDQSTLPEAAKFVIRYHSFYPLHREGAYEYLMDDKDREYLSWLKTFNQYDLYSKSTKTVNVEALMPYYTQLIDKYFPNKKIRW